MSWSSDGEPEKTGSLENKGVGFRSCAKERTKSVQRGENEVARYSLYLLYLAGLLPETAEGSA
jgi:hypothetical protein